MTFKRDYQKFAIGGEYIEITRINVQLYFVKILRIIEKKSVSKRDVETIN